MNIKNRKNDKGENFDYEKQLENTRREGKCDQNSLLIFKSENDALVNNLLHNIRNVKNFSLQINTNLKMSNSTIEDMDKKYAESNSLLGDTMKRLGDVLSANSSYFCYLIIFLFVVFFFLYKITS